MDREHKHSNEHEFVYIYDPSEWIDFRHVAIIVTNQIAVLVAQRGSKRPVTDLDYCARMIEVWQSRKIMTLDLISGVFMRMQVRLVFGPWCSSNRFLCTLWCSDSWRFICLWPVVFHLAHFFYLPRGVPPSDSFCFVWARGVSPSNSYLPCCVSLSSVSIVVDPWCFAPVFCP